MYDINSVRRRPPLHVRPSKHVVNTLHLDTMQHRHLLAMVTIAPTNKNMWINAPQAFDPYDFLQQQNEPSFKHSASDSIVM